VATAFSINQATELAPDSIDVYTQQHSLRWNAALIVQVLHEARVQQTRREDPNTFAWLECLRSQNLLYVTPKNMNDDLFWMYTPIHGRAGARLVSA